MEQIDMKITPHHFSKSSLVQIINGLLDMGVLEQGFIDELFVKDLEVQIYKLHEKITPLHEKIKRCRNFSSKKNRQLVQDYNQLGVRLQKKMALHEQLTQNTEDENATNKS